ncbi:hypothetical protein BGW37DRAFT_275700 [Umbelopsis sp. PMI_123]|nr:hypothetical protein BGW37DRAFT_275700 [Umbelopsis sp. PMI_123]
MPSQLCKRWLFFVIIAACTLFISLHTLSQTPLPIQAGLEKEELEPERSITTHINDNISATDEEKFMTFYPHSGLHNQRLSLVNAALIAKWLNRTLIIPEVNIAVATYWKNSSELPHKLDACPELVMAHREMEKKLGERIHLPSECFEYRKYVPVSFEDLFDLSPLTNIGVRYIMRNNMHHSFFQESPLYIPYDETNRTLVYEIPDYERYSYRIYFSEHDDQPLQNFERRINLVDLQQRSEKLMIFNSMFGSNRISVDTENADTKEYLRMSIKISHPVVDSRADQVISMLGGERHYISAHIRSGDGIFKDHITDTIDQITRQLTELVDMENDQTDITIWQELRKLQLSRKPQSIDTLRDRCAQLQPQRGKLTTLFMATDSKHPREDPNMRSLFDQFVCAFTLTDFPQIIPSINVISPRDNHTDISSLLIPLVDASIASSGSDFVGTPKSTFSGYVKNRQKAISRLISDGV